MGWSMSEPHPGSVWTASNGETRTVIGPFERRCGSAIAYEVNGVEDWCYVEDWEKWVTEHDATYSNPHN